MDDDSWSNVDLGFDVTYFGQTFDNITIYNNGMALFGDNRGYAENCCNGYKPTQDQHDYGIFPFWTDLITINNNTTTGLQGVYYLSDNTDTFQMAWIDISEFYNDQTSNTFGVEIKSTSTGASIDFFYDELDIRNHSIWSGLTGDISEGEVIENFFHNQQNGMFTGDSSLDWSYNVTSIDCSNPLNDPSCKGYEEAYFEQQCSSDALYDQQCPGYEQAYLDQQCQQDSLYDPSCPGYEQAYEDQQCSQDPLWSPKCQGYYQAYEEQQCERDPQWSFVCPGFKQEEIFTFESFNSFEDYSLGDTGAEYDAFGNVKEDEFKFEEPKPEDFYQYEQLTFGYAEEEFIFEERFVFEDEFKLDEPELEFTPELDEFIPEDVREAIIELEERIEQAEDEEELKEIFEEFVEEFVEDDKKNEEIEENVVAFTETPTEEVSDERGTTEKRSSGSKIGLSVGLGTANSLVSSLISRSIESGLSNAAQGVGSGGFYGSDTQNMANLAATGGNFSNFSNTITSDQQNDMDAAADIGVGPVISLGTNVNLGNMTVEIIREPSLAEKMAERVRKKNLDNQKGIFNKQISILEGIASASNLNNYYESRLADASSWYGTEQIYPKNSLTDKNKSFYRLNSENYGTMQQLIRSQY
ncbi:hypothetical protein OAA34_00040 [bacterium]|nr:hypothetical protein [bacterium]